MASNTATKYKPGANASRLMLTEKQLADRWQRSISSLRNDRVAGKGADYLKLGGSVRYPLEDIEAYEAAARRQSTSDRGS